MENVARVARAAARHLLLAVIQPIAVAVQTDALGAEVADVETVEVRAIARALDGDA